MIKFLSWKIDILMATDLFFACIFLSNQYCIVLIAVDFSSGFLWL